MHSIRQGTLIDFDQIIALSKELFLYEKKFTDTYNENWPYHNQGKEYYAKRMVNDKSIFYVVEDESKIVGFLLGYIENYPVRTINPIAELENIFVIESYRNKGIGTELMQKFKEDAKKHGVKRLKVHLYAANEEAKNFYRKHGFQELAITMETNFD